MDCSTVSDVGFFHGLLHGVIALYSLLGDVLWDMSMYEHCQLSWWYDLGFVVGLGLFFMAVVRFSIIVVPIMLIVWIVQILVSNIILTLGIVLALVAGLYLYKQYPKLKFNFKLR